MIEEYWQLFLDWFNPIFNTGFNTPAITLMCLSILLIFLLYQKVK